jgi:hypothetical protein
MLMSAQVVRSTVVSEKEWLVLQALSSEQRQQMFDFAESLTMRSPKDAGESRLNQSKRCRDLDKGAVLWMSEDFDEPLPDEFWYGENDPLMMESSTIQSES